MGEGLITRRGAYKNNYYNMTFTTTSEDGENATFYDEHKYAVKRIDISSIKNKYSYVYIYGLTNGGNPSTADKFGGLFSLSTGKFLISGYDERDHYNGNYVYKYNIYYLGFEIVDDELVLFVTSSPEGNPTYNKVFELTFM